MKHLRFLFTLFFFSLLYSLSVRSASYQESIKVGEKKTLEIPSAQTSKSGFKVTSSWSCSNTECIKVISGSYSRYVTIEALKWPENGSTIYLSCYTESDTGSEKFEFNILVDEPFVEISASPSGGHINKGQSVSLECVVSNVGSNARASDAQLYYRLDGYSPTTSDLQYNSYSKIIINESCTLKAIALWNGKKSGVLTAEYSVDDLYVSANPRGGDCKEGNCCKFIML